MQLLWHECSLQSNSACMLIGSCNYQMNSYPGNPCSQYLPGARTAAPATASGCELTCCLLLTVPRLLCTAASRPDPAKQSTTACSNQKAGVHAAANAYEENGFSDHDVVVCMLPIMILVQMLAALLGCVALHKHRTGSQKRSQAAAAPN